MKALLLGLLLFDAALLPTSPRLFPTPKQFMTLSSNGKYLVDSFTNDPVFVTGEDGSLLTIQISNADVETYLRDRARKGFNVIWVNVIDADTKGATRPFAGNVPFNGPDFTSFNEAYWSHIDFVVKRARDYGITLGMGVAFVAMEGGFRASINRSSDAVLKEYGRFLGNRYKHFPNIIWVLGGDADPQYVSYTKINMIGAGIAEADPNHIMTLEAIRVSTPPDLSTWSAYKGRPPAFINLNWVYNKQPSVVPGCQAAYKVSLNGLPPLMGEDWYELEHSMTAFQVRQEGYWATLSGCYLGRLFGNGPIWSFNSPNTGFSSGPSWKTQLNSAGSLAHEYYGKLLSSREHWLMVPDMNHDVLTSGFGSGANLSVAARSSDGQTIIAYFSDGNATAKTIDMRRITSATSKVRAWWYDPRSGVAKLIDTFPNSGTRNFIAPDRNDWVLVLDDASANLPAPGVSSVSHRHVRKDNGREWVPRSRTSTEIARQTAYTP